MAPIAAIPQPRRLLAFALAVLAVLLFAPAAAQASYASVGSTGKLTYTAFSGEVNNLVVSPTADGRIELTESGRFGSHAVLIGGGKGCGGLGPRITCSGVTSIVVGTGAGADRIDATALSIPMTVTAGEDDDVVLTGSGTDTVACGAGADRVEAEQQDSVAADCETVVRERSGPAEASPTHEPEPDPEPQPETEPGAPGPDTQILGAPFNLAAPVIPPQTASVTAAGVALVQVGCPLDAGTCRGTVALVLVDGGGKAKVVSARRRKPVSLGRSRFSARAGEKPIVRVQLNRRGRRRVMRSRGRKSRARVVVTTHTAAGETLTTTRDITLRARRRAARGNQGRR